MKATKSGRIVGYALQAWTGNEKRDANAPQQALSKGVGMILVLIQPTWMDDDNKLNLNDIAINGMIAYPNANIGGVSEKSLLESQQAGFSLLDMFGNSLTKTAAFADAVVGNVRVGLLKALRIETDSIKADKADIVDASIERLNSQVVTAKNVISEGLTIEKGGIENIRFDGEGNAVFKGTVFAGRIVAGHIDGLDNLESKVASLESMITASKSAQIVVEPSPMASFSPSISEESVLSASTSALLSSLKELSLAATPSIATDVATVSGLTVSNNATVSGNLNVSGSSLIEGILNVIQTITTNNFIVSGWSHFSGSTIFSGDTFFSGRPVFNKDTAGSVVMKRNTDSITVTFEREYADNPVITANLTIGSTGNIDLENAVLNGELRYIITKKSKKGFSIKLNKKAPDNLEFSWVALASKDIAATIDELEPMSISPTISLPIDYKDREGLSSPSATPVMKKLESKL